MRQAAVVGQTTNAKITEVLRGAGRKAHGLMKTLIQPALEKLNYDVKLGRPGARETYSALDLVFRMRDTVEGANMRWYPAITRTWGDIKLSRREALKDLLGMPPEIWDNVAVQRFGAALSVRERTALEQTLLFMDQFAASHGIDNGSSIWSAMRLFKEEYVTRLGRELSVAGPNGTQVSLAKILDDSIKSVAPNNKLFETFRISTRSQDLWRMMQELDPMEAMGAMVNRVHTRVFMEETIGPIHRALLALQADPTGNRALIDYFVKTLDDVVGVESAAQAAISSAGEALSKGLVRGFQAIERGLHTTALTNVGLIDELKFRDPIAKMNSNFTVSTQSFRAFYGIRGVVQLTIPAQIYGMGPMLEALEYVLDHPEYISRLQKEGLLSEGMFDVRGTNLTTLGRVKEFGLRPVGNADTAVRAATYRAAEVAFEKTAPRFQSGLINEDAFMRETGTVIFSDAEREPIMALMRSGNVRAAAQEAGEIAQRITSGLYGPGTQGTVSRGPVGKMFGKFMNYPMMQMAFVDRLASMQSRASLIGNVGTNVARIGIMAGTMWAVYKAFELMGIDYRGFLMTNAAESWGGPLWQGLTALPKFFGDQEMNRQARMEVGKVVTRSIVPMPLYGSAAYDQMIGNPWIFLESGAPWSAAKSLFGMPTNSDMEKSMLRTWRRTH